MATEPGQGPVAPRATTGATPAHSTTVRRTDETKPAFKTTEFIAYIAVTIGVLAAGAMIKGADEGTDEFISPLVWTLVVVLTVGYMLSRGIAKSGSRHRYSDDDRH